MQDLGERTLDWAGDRLRMVDQTRLPDAYEVLEIDNVADLVDAIGRLAVTTGDVVPGPMGLRVPRWGEPPGRCCGHVTAHGS